MTIISIGHTSKSGQQLAPDSLFHFPSFKIIYKMAHCVEPEAHIPPHLLYISFGVINDKLMCIYVPYIRGREVVT